MAQTMNYVLLKYSRSYSSSDSARFSTQPTSSDSEWQHFANPKLQLVLDDASPVGSSRSAKVKIIWVPVGNGVQHVQQENGVILEDIDLSSYSPSSTAPQKSHSQSPPLKVVYRDSVVGFRYLHPRVVPSGALPTFRRFQICFTDPLLAIQFVDSIRHICPCKASPQAALAQSRTMAATADTVAASRVSSLQANKTHISTESFPLASQHACRMLHLSSSALVNNLPNQSSVPLPDDQAIKNSTESSGLPLCGPRTSPLDTVVAASRGDRSLQVSQTTGTPIPPPISIAGSSSQEHFNNREQANPEQTDFHPRISCSTAALSAGSSDPSSRSGNSTQRYVTSSIDTLVDALSTTPNLTCSEAGSHNGNLNEKLSAASQAVDPPNCLRDLCGIKELCEMPMEQLEQLVGEVIRDPEFLTLLEKLDVMWKVKGIITRASKEA